MRPDDTDTDIENEIEHAAVHVEHLFVDPDDLSNGELAEHCLRFVGNVEFGVLDMIGSFETGTGERVTARQVIDVCGTFHADVATVMPMTGYLPRHDAPVGSRDPGDYEDVHALDRGTLVFRCDRVTSRGLFLRRYTCPSPCRQLVPFDASPPSHYDRQPASVH